MDRDKHFASVANFTAAELVELAEARCQLKTNRWKRRMAVLTLILLVLVPIGVFGLPREISRWHEAAAVAANTRGDLPAANAALDRALQWWPENPAALARRGDWKLKVGDYQGSLDDYRLAAQADPQDVNLVFKQMTALQHLKRHAEAIAIIKKLVADHAHDFAGNRANLANGLAYAQALGNVELPDALKNVENSIALIGESAEVLDTRGLIQLRLGNVEAALGDLNVAVQAAEQRLTKLQRDRTYEDPAAHDEKVQLAKLTLAVIRYHRAMALDAGQQSKAAAADRQRVRELGFEPNEDLL